MDVSLNVLHKVITHSFYLIILTRCVCCVSLMPQQFYELTKMSVECSKVCDKKDQFINYLIVLMEKGRGEIKVRKG